MAWYVVKHMANFDLSVTSYFLIKFCKANKNYFACHLIFQDDLHP